MIYIYIYIYIYHIYILYVYTFNINKYTIVTYIHYIQTINYTCLLHYNGALQFES